MSLPSAKNASFFVRVMALAEAATGLLLTISPSIVTGLLFAAPVTGTADIVGRIAGIALVALGIACWANSDVHNGLGRYSGLLTYNALTALLLTAAGLSGQPTGMLLWPAIAIHGAFAIGIAWLWRGDAMSAPVAL